MQAYLEDAEQNGAKLLLKTEVVGGHLQGTVMELDELSCRLHSYVDPTLSCQYLKAWRDV